MSTMDKAKSIFIMTGRMMNEAISFIVFSFLDILDFLLCYTYKVIDFIVEAEWKPCYCSSAKEAMKSSGTILVSEQGESKIVCLSTSSGRNKLQLEEISDTLYTRSSLVSEVSKSTVNELKRLKLENATVKKGTLRSTFTVNSTIVEMLQGKIGGQQYHPIPRWSDCDCKTCNSWSSSCKDTLFVHVDGVKENVQENVIFIHGFISSSAFWTETLFPNFTKAAKSKYRLFAVDLLGFGRSPKPNDSLYTLREHLDMIEKSVLEPYKVKSFHIVAHSLGCILALALAVKHPGLVKSLTLLAPVSCHQSSQGLFNGNGLIFVLYYSELLNFILVILLIHSYLCRWQIVSYLYVPLAELQRILGGLYMSKIFRANVQI
nr:probable lysophospholipase BODYGUARD 3 [Nicotiana tomentosiformis]